MEEEQYLDEDGQKGCIIFTLWQSPTPMTIADFALLHELAFTVHLLELFKALEKKGLIEQWKIKAPSGRIYVGYWLTDSARAEIDELDWSTYPPTPPHTPTAH
jgi:hypothetical protein